MEGRLVLKRCSILRADGRVRGDMAVVVEDGRISRIAPDAEVPALPGDWEISCRGRLVMAGLVDCHTHLVGGQLFPPNGGYLLRSARARFELMDRTSAAMTPAEVEVIAAHGIAQALRRGVTLAFDHLLAPSAVLASLDAEARSARRLGLRLVVSHATHSVPGPVSPEEQAEANAAFSRAWRTDPWVRGAMGFHASATSDDELLRRVGRLREELGVGAHFRLAESEEDLATTWVLHGRRVVPRLESFGLLGAGSVGALARAVDFSEAGRLSRTRTLIALSPKTSLSLEPSGTSIETLLSQQPLLGLGTGGNGTLWHELVAAFNGAVQIARQGRLLDPDGLMAQLLVSGPAELCSMIFGAPSGSLEVGALADLVVHDHVPALDDIQSLVQLAEVPVAWTIVNGRVSVREGQVVGSDLLELSSEAARAVEAVRARVGASRDVA